MPVTTGDTNCPQNVMVSNAINDWLITQYINTTLSSSESANDVEVNIQFTCTGNCSSNLALLYYPTNTPLEFSINMFMSIGQAMNGINSVTGINTSGFFLAIQAMGAISVTVAQISIIPTICRAETINLINFPEAYPTATSRVGSCTAGSEQSGGSPIGSCGSNGMWETSSSCVCIAGYFLQNDSCTGTRHSCTCTRRIKHVFIVYIFIIGGWWLKCLSMPLHTCTYLTPFPNIFLNSLSTWNL